MEELAIHFLHAPSRLTLRFVFPPDSPVDLLAIASPFSLDPSSLLFNGHFLSRNPSFLSSLTWRQLLSFFLARGFASGRHPLDPVRVDGTSSLPPCLPDANVVMSDLNSKSLKRSIEQADLSPSITAEKRLRQESVSGAIISMSETPPLSSNLKRGPREDTEAHCTWDKRNRHEGCTGTASIECDRRVLSSKLKRKPDEVPSAYGTWGKRTRHEGCSAIIDTLQWRCRAELTP